MFIAIETLSATLQWIVYLIALVSFVLAAIGWSPSGSKVSLLAVGLAFFTFPFFWNNLAAS